MMYYFAYGSNMDQQQMSTRCPNAKLLGEATLNGYQLAFTIFSKKRGCGCADIVLSNTDQVHGLLYQVTKTDIRALDDFEGHPIHYKRIEAVVHTLNGPVDSFSYEVVNKSNHLKPSKHYLGLIKQASQTHSFPKEYQAMLNDIETID